MIRSGSSVGASPTRLTQSLQPVAIEAAVEVTKPSEPSRQMCRSGDAASRQAVTRVNVEQASKRPMRRRPCAGKAKAAIAGDEWKPLRYIVQNQHMACPRIPARIPSHSAARFVLAFPAFLSHSSLPPCFGLTSPFWPLNRYVPDSAFRIV